jgi:hypothetical protein
MLKHSSNINLRLKKIQKTISPIKTEDIYIVCNQNTTKLWMI